MNETMNRLLLGGMENHIFPFFWQHGEDEATLREYVGTIEGADCRAFCVESRPHPDFCGPGWWRDMDIILDEARIRNMKVWILDDSHFPTGFANGALRDAPVEFHRQSVCANRIECFGPAAHIELDLNGLIPPPFQPVNLMEQYVLPSMIESAPHYDDDEVIALTAVCKDNGDTVFLPLPDKAEPLKWEKPEGDWTVWVIGLSRNCGPHRDYINMLEPSSCQLLLDAVYEPHWEHYGDDFGTTIAGFFSDEPELGNGHMYCMDNVLGTDQDLPFARTLPEKLTAALGHDWANRLYLLWDNSGDAAETARVRYRYMDAVTKLVRQNFSRQIGDWCRNHGVEYIGHMIEDGNAHARTGSGLGHYFRGLDGQDMAGIDDIGGQILPQGEDAPMTGNLGMDRDGEFYHFMLGNLAASAAAIQRSKQGRAMCEVFGNYGWAEGVRLEKYLADHLMVRGINYFVPHAFDPAPFPDTDCPPHFYAHGHNPQYRHFGALMAYMNRICSLTSGGNRIAPAAILYHGEAEWCGKAMLSQKPARRLAEAQIEYTTIPCDVFAEQLRYGTKIGDILEINGHTYRTLIVPESQFVTAAFAKAAALLHAKGFPVLFINRLPEGVCDGENALLEPLAGCPVLTLDELVPAMYRMGLPEAKISPANRDLRVMHYQGECELYYLVNEGAAAYEGMVTIPYTGSCYWYDAWENKVYPANPISTQDDTGLKLALEPRKSLLLLLDEPDPGLLSEPVSGKGLPVTMEAWRRSICEGAEYPGFKEERTITLPDRLAEERPNFSGFVRYESVFNLKHPCPVVLEIADASEGVEVFVNGRSAGIQIVPTYRYDLTELVRAGKNTLVIEVATTLERQCYHLIKDDPRSKLRGLQSPVCGSGITGKVTLYFREEVM